MRSTAPWLRGSCSRPKATHPGGKSAGRTGAPTAAAGTSRAFRRIFARRPQPESTARIGATWKRAGPPELRTKRQNGRANRAAIPFKSTPMPQKRPAECSRLKGFTLIVHGTISKKLETGDRAECAYMYDTEKNELIQVGGEAYINAEDIDLIQAMIELRHLANESTDG